MSSFISDQRLILLIPPSDLWGTLLESADQLSMHGVPTREKMRTNMNMIAMRTTTLSFSCSSHSKCMNDGMGDISVSRTKGRIGKGSISINACL